MDKQQLYENLLTDIWNRTQGDATTMTLTDRMTYHIIMKDLKESMLSFWTDNYKAILYWADYPIEEDIKLFSQPDMNQLNKLMTNRAIEMINRGIL